MKKKQIKKEPVEIPEDSSNEEDTLVQDQRKRGYYYDDAHGYRKYVPNESEEGDDAGEESD